MYKTPNAQSWGNKADFAATGVRGYHTHVTVPLGCLVVKLL